MRHLMFETLGPWLLVPVVDEETGIVFQWDVHPNHRDWSATDAVASGATLQDAKRDLSDFVRRERSSRVTQRAFGNEDGPRWCACNKCLTWWMRLH